MTEEQITELQRTVHAEPDGFWGPQSQRATIQYLRRLMPAKSPWPKTDTASLEEFYGTHGDESKLVNLDVSDLGMKYDGQPVKTVRCHTKVAASLKRALEEVKKYHPEVLERYAGVYNNRPMRGGSKPSLHAYGAAIDLWPEQNGNHQHWPVDAKMPLRVMECFAKEGWLPAGAAWSRDAMHFQATYWA